MVSTVNLQRVLIAQDGSVLAAGEYETILRSTDSGDSWNVAFQGPVRSTAYVDLSRAGDHRVLAILGGLKLMQSTDDGGSWTQIQNPASGNEYLRTISVQSPDTWWILSTRALYRTTDAGTTWEEPAGYNARGLVRFVFADSLYGYQLRDGQLLQTHDGGVTWKEMNIFGFDVNVGLATGGAFGETVYCLSQGNYIVNKSTSGGADWSVSLTGSAFEEAVPYAMSFADPKVGLVAGDGGRILRTEDGGTAWSVVHGVGFLGSLSDLVFTTPKRGLAMSYAKSILITSNGGVRWDEVQPSAVYALQKVSMYNELEGYAFGLDDHYRTAVFYTSNGGRNWTLRSELNLSQDLFSGIEASSIASVSRDTLWIGITYGLAYRSVDGAVTWDSLVVHPDLQQIYNTGDAMFTFSPSSVVYTSPFGIAYSNDAGMHWRYNRNNSGRTISEARFFSPAQGVALLSGIFASTVDSGKTWQLSNQSNLQLIHFFDMMQGKGLSLRTHGSDEASVLSTTDGGETWSEHPMHERIAWSDWFFISPEEGWAFGYGGMIRHTQNGGVTGVDEAPVSGADFSLGRNYPNPFSLTRDGATTIPFTVPDGTRDHVRLEVFDALGRPVATLFDRTASGGRYYAVFDPVKAKTQIASGLYICRLSVGVRQWTTSMLLLK